MPGHTHTFVVEHYRRRTMMGLGPTEHRWRAVHNRNGKILAQGQGYSRLVDLRDTCRLLFGHDVRFAEVEA